MAEASKFDGGKPRVELLDPLAIEGLANVLAFGAKKYGDHNWRKGMPNSKIIASIFRHLLAIMRNELLDDESGLPHIDHLGAEWMFLSYQFKARPELNDNWKLQESQKGLT